MGQSAMLGPTAGKMSVAGGTSIEGFFLAFIVRVSVITRGIIFVHCLHIRQASIHIQLLISTVIIGSRPSDHYFRSVYVCLSVCLFVCAEFFSAVFDPISIKLGHMLYVWV